MDKVVDMWNKGPGKKDQITVTVKKQASGDTLVTKILTAHKAGKAPDLVQAEYQALPTLVSNDALADISEEVERREGQVRRRCLAADDARHRTRSTRYRRTSGR